MREEPQHEAARVHWHANRAGLDPKLFAGHSCVIQARLGPETLPEALVRQVPEKAEGNPLFAKEIVTFLLEWGILRVEGGKLDSDARALAAALCHL